MLATATPNPFPAPLGYTITVTGGTPPYQYSPMPSPPNPPGVVVQPGPPVLVTVPSNTPSGTSVDVLVTDSARPPNTAMATSTVL